MTAATRPSPRASLAFRLIEAGIPPTLLLDLAGADSLRSSEIMAHERATARPTASTGYASAVHTLGG